MSLPIAHYRAACGERPFSFPTKVTESGAFHWGDGLNLPAALMLLVLRLICRGKQAHDWRLKIAMHYEHKWASVAVDYATGPSCSRLLVPKIHTSPITMGCDAASF